MPKEEPLLVEILKWLVKQGVRFIVEDNQETIKLGLIGVYRYFLENGWYYPRDSVIAARKNRLTFLKMIHDFKFPISPEAANQAAYMKDFQMMDWLAHRNIDVGESLPLVKWLLKHGIFPERALYDFFSL